MSENQQNTNEPVTGTVRERDTWMTPAQRERVQDIRTRNAMVAAITQTSWGNALSEPHRRALAEFIRRFKLDLSEVNILGGMPYRNGYYYRRRLAELAGQGRIDWMAGEHIGPDERLDVMEKSTDPETAAYAAKENARRLKERIRLAVPADAQFAFVARVKMTALGAPLEGCKYIVPEKKKTGWRNGKQVEVDADPVGDANPVETVESRAWRRVGLLAAAEIPELAQSEAAMETAGREIMAGATEQTGREAAQRVEIGGTRVTTQDMSDPYEVDDEPKQITAPVPETFIATETMEPQELPLGDTPAKRTHGAREG